MREINIAKVIITKRKEKGVTQDELAEYVGVSKASVSKWETGQSYPDITFLPQLATYFNISIDELMGYSPQMTKEDIRKLYHKFAAQFATEPFNKIITECRTIIKKYYSCFPLLLQMVILFVNHFMYAGHQEQQEEILREATELCIRVRTESGNIWLTKKAIYMQSICYLTLKEPQSVLDLFGENIRPNLPEEPLISKAYQLMGKTVKAKEVMQISIYQHLKMTLDSMLNYLLLCEDNMNKAEEILNRTLSLAKIFNMEKLDPNMVILLYASGAKVYCINGYYEKAVDMLDKYIDVCIKRFFPYILHGDSFFDSIDDWLSDMDLGAEAPRSKEVIKESMMREILMNPVFSVLEEMPKYKSIIQKFKNFMEQN
ncbi:helix-turn-helix domain-containing protein [Clostridium sp. WILCCON 0269]|uniref:Helix-turn-helix domain-containing protein n=1 Tax=Candidatus Clostridium eludens TaxID=3381663 RepID=A0ABW8SH35_9CLOT